MAKTRYHSPDYWIVGLSLFLVAFGLVMLSSAGAVVGYQRFGQSNYFVKQQLFYFFVGLAVMLVLSVIDYHRWRKLAFPLLVCTIILLMMVFIPGIGFEAGGASRWIQLPFTGVQTSSMMVQPSEILKVIFLLYLAVWLEKRGSGVRNLAYGLLPFAFLLCVIVGLIIGQPDLGTVTIIVMTGIILYFIAGAPWKHLILLGVGGLVALGIVIQIAPYRAQRLMVFLNPGEDPQVAGYHINQSLLAIGSGGLFGVGLGHSRQKFNYLPEVTSDSIFAVIAEEFGFVLVVGLLLVFFTFLRKGMKIARDAPDAFGKYCAAGITVLIVMQASINIAALSGILPLTGITLPFISAGGSSLVAMMAGVGILANISRQTRP